MKLFKPFASLLIVATFALAAGCASTSTQESTGEMIDDATITTKVKAAIFDEPTLKVAQISVETYKSAVQLSGFVSTSAEVSKAAAVARSVKGVASVQNNLRLK